MKDVRDSMKMRLSSLPAWVQVWVPVVCLETGYFILVPLRLECKMQINLDSCGDLM